MAKQSYYKDMVLKAYRKNKSLVNSDAKLVAWIWRKEGWSDEFTLEYNLLNVSNWDCLTRARRDLHEHGFIQYSKEVEKKRFGLFKAHTEHYSTQKQTWLKQEPIPKKQGRLRKLFRRK